MLRFAVFLSVLVAVAAPWAPSEALAFSPDNIKFKGDLRLRYQYDKQYGDASEKDAARHRERIRFRVGFETEVNERLAAAVRLAGGSADPRSTNQSLGDFFSSKGFYLDEAYLIWAPADWVMLKGGKFGSAFYTADDLLWDGDITFEGQAAGFDLPRGDGLTLFFNSAMFVLDELKAEATDPYMVLAQPGVKVRPGNGLEVVAAVAYYGFAHLQDVVSQYSAGTNTRTGEPGMLAEQGLKYAYDSVNPVLGLTAVWESKGGTAYSAGIIGDMVYSMDSEDTGYLVGLKGGHASVKDLGSWQVSYNRRRLEADAFPDIFPDSDFYGGATNVVGHEFILNVGLGKGATLGVDYYRGEQTEGDPDASDLLQADLGVKF
jgi:hypothetical protein